MALPSDQGSGTTQGGAPAGSTGSPSASGATTAPSSLEATPVTSKNLPAATDLVFGDQAYTVAETYRGDGQAPVAACQTMGWQDAGPNAVWTRTYNGKDGRFAGGHQRRLLRQPCRRGGGDGADGRRLRGLRQAHGGPEP